MVLLALILQEQEISIKKLSGKIENPKLYKTAINNPIHGYY